MERFFSKKILVLFVLLLSIPAILPYFHSGYFPTHDGEWAVVRLADMFRSLRDLQFPVRMSGALNFGYGYPLFNFAYPFPYYFGVLLHFLTGSFVTSIKTIFLLSVLLSGVFMYMCSYELWKDKYAAFVSSVFYIYFPYRMVDLYVRGSIGESVSFALFPLILFLSIRLFDTSSAKFIGILLSISIAMLIGTHNIMTVLFMPLLISFVLGRILIEKRFDVLFSFLLSVLLSLGLSSFFWFPALYEKNNILLSKIPIADRSLYFVNFKQLLIPSWGYAPPTENGGFSYQLGLTQIVAVLTALIVLIISLIKNRLTQTPLRIYSIMLMILYILCFAFLFSFTAPVWKAVPLLKEINFPWTLLSQLGFLSALIAGFLVIQGKLFKYLLIVLSVISIIFILPYARPQSYVDRGDAFYITNEATTTSSSELMPLWVKEMPLQHFKDKVEVLAGDAQISNLKYDSKLLTFNYKTDTDSVFQINTIYYPGWKAYLNGEEIKIDYDNPKGVMQIAVSQYRDTVAILFKETPARMTSDVVSVVSILIILLVILLPSFLFKK